MMRIFIFAWYGLMTAVTFCVMAFDKHRARVHGWRVPEANLLLLGLLGGGLGGCLGMWLCRHKTRHVKFLIGYPLLTLLHALLLWQLLIRMAA